MSTKSTDKASVRKRGIKELLGGVAVAAVGGLATFASYNAARPGESYTVYTGIIALGVVYAVLGVWHIAFPKVSSLKSNNNAPKDTEPVEAEIVKEED